MASQAADQPHHLRDNTLRVYYGLDESMINAHKNDDHAHAESTARILLEHSDLPLLIRARALMILGCSLEPDYLEMAAEAVRIVEVGIDSMKSEGRMPGDIEKQLLEDCEKVHQEALVDSGAAVEGGEQSQIVSEQGIEETAVEQDHQHDDEDKLERRPVASSSTGALSAKTMDAVEHSEMAGFGGGSPYKNPMRKEEVKGDEDEGPSQENTDEKDADVEMASPESP